MKNGATVRRAERAACKALAEMKVSGTLKQACDALAIPPELPGQFGRAHREAIVWFRQFVKHGGLVLDPEFWRTEAGAVEAVSAGIEAALEKGWDSSRAAAEFIHGGLADEVIDTQVWDGDYDQISELFHSQINRSHGTVYMVGAETTPGFCGFKYHLSPCHPEHDVCDLLAEQNVFGLGNGVYPSTAQCPWPAHSGTLSFVQIVFKDEVTDADRAGKETSLEALARLSPEARQGVLGVTKAKYFEGGLLQPWMIRSRLPAVQARLVRLGLLDGNTLESDPIPYEDEEE